LAIRINFAGASILQPGAYTTTQVAQASLAAPSVGIVALIGESTEGIPFSSESGLSAVAYGPDEFQAIQDKYGSGELVDAAALAISPSNDQAISGGAQQLFILKTNASTFASATMEQGSSAYGTVTAKNAGTHGNQASFSVAIVSGKAVITVNRLDTGVTEVSSPLGNNPMMSIQCTDATATAATCTITATQLTTTVTGGTTAPLALDLAKFPTVSQLCAYINSVPGYTATAASAKLGNQSSSQLDEITAADIKTATLPIKMDAYEVASFFASSALVSFAPTISSGLPTVAPKTFLSGGALGATTQAAFQSCLDALMSTRINFIVPLFSRDASGGDIAAGLTDPSSTYSIDSIHAAVVSHCNTASTVKGRKERQGFVAYKGTFADTEEKAAGLSAARAQMLFQDVDVLAASTGLVTTKQPHMLAVAAAGMKAAANIGLPNTFKNVLILGFSHADFDPETMADEGIAANLCFVMKNPQGGFRFELDNSTYGSDTNAWIYNRPSVLYAADVAAYAIRLNTEQFVGQRNSDVSTESVKNLLVGVMDQLKTAGITVGDANSGGRGYTNLSVSISGSVVSVGVTLVLVEGLEFVLGTIKVQRAG
jgi:hypothetical protein